MASEKFAQVSVFIFLDENVSHGPVDKLKSANVSAKYKLKIIPFPPIMRYLAIFDFQVVLFLKKLILSRQYNIRRVLYNHPSPIFIFITGDGGFVGDAEKGFADWTKMGRLKGKRKRKETIKNIEFSPETVSFRLNNNFIVHVHIRFIKGGGNDTTQIVIKKIIKELESFLA